MAVCDTVTVCALESECYIHTNCRNTYVYIYLLKIYLHYKKQKVFPTVLNLKDCFTLAESSFSHHHYYYSFQILWIR